jgi:hypothetical protein
MTKQKGIKVSTGNWKMEIFLDRSAYDNESILRWEAASLAFEIIGGKVDPNLRGIDCKFLHEPKDEISYGILTEIDDDEPRFVSTEMIFVNIGEHATANSIRNSLKNSE